MDESTGLLTTICQHDFHCACLEQWRGSGCPVCRYTQNDVSSTDDSSEKPECSECGATDNLWICVICGNIGCGRYYHAHSKKHWAATNHSYAMQISTQYIWDYVEDTWVHRLIQKEGKMVDLPASTGSRLPNAATSMHGDTLVSQQKKDEMAFEYGILLSQELESVRKYWEEQMEKAIEAATEKATLTVTELSRELASLKTKYAELHIDSQDKIKQLRKELAALQTKYTESQNKIRQLEKNASATDEAARKIKDLSDELATFKVLYSESQEQIKQLGNDNTSLARELATMKGLYSESQEKTVASADRAARQLDAMSVELATQRNQYEESQVKIKELEIDIERRKAQAASAQDEVRKITKMVQETEKEFKDEVAMNKQLMENNQRLKKDLDDAAEEHTKSCKLIEEYQVQVKEAYLNLEQMQNLMSRTVMGKITREEARNARIEIGPSASEPLNAGEQKKTTRKERRKGLQKKDEGTQQEGSDKLP
jgi:chromosome segregation ATPase